MQSSRRTKELRNPILLPKGWTIQAAAPAAAALLQLTGDVKIEAAAGGDRPGPRRFDIVAYTGGKLFLANFDHPVVVDLEGVSGTHKSRPIFKDHNKALVVGHTDRIGNDGRQLTASGVVSGTGPAAKEVVANNDNGFPWQASIGARPTNTEFVTAGRQVNVNGQTFEGPVIVARRTRLNEISFVALGADDDTSARIAANAAEGAPMTFEQWLASKEIAADGLSDAVKKVLRAQYDAEIKATADDDDGADDPDDGKKGKGGKKAPKSNKTPKIEATADDADDDEVDLVADQRTRLVADRKRGSRLWPGSRPRIRSASRPRSSPRSPPRRSRTTGTPTSSSWS
jgi:hypothetical protein